MSEVIQVDSEILGGTPVFRKTRVPIETLFDYIEGGDSIDDFLYDFPTVTKNEVLRLLDDLKSAATHSKVA